jgi:putative toxin-antitoxin system antitoxin component (TIGR02293 family)
MMGRVSENTKRIARKGVMEMRVGGTSGLSDKSTVRAKGLGDAHAMVPQDAVIIPARSVKGEIWKWKEAHPISDQNRFRMLNLEFIETFRRGVDPTEIDVIAEHMGTTKKNLQGYLQLSTTTVERKKSKAANLDVYQSERVAGLRRLIDQVQAMVEDSGDPTGFDAAEWLGRWIEKPLPALGGKKPAEYLSTVTGQNMLSDLLNQMQHGAYA